MTAIKICGLQTRADVAAVNAAHPDYAGFVFAGGRHHVSLTQALALRDQLDANIPSVGVFVNAPLSDMLAAFNSGAISIIQLHGTEPEAIVQLLQERGAHVIRVFQGDQTQLPTTQADWVMADAGAGSGQTLDWHRIVQPTTPLFLAGGLTPDNVATAIQQVHPFAVDVSSGVERGGHKDATLVRQFVERARQADLPH